MQIDSSLLTVKMGDRDGVKLFVYGVASSCPKSVIETEFERFGKTLDVFITGKGYAFVTMEDIDDAKELGKVLSRYKDQYYFQVKSD